MRKLSLRISGLAVILVMAGCAGNMAELGLDNEKLKPCPESPNCVSSQAPDADHFVEPIRLTVSQEEARRMLLHTLEEMKASQITEVADDYLRAEFKSRLFRFVDDVELYFPDSESEGVLVHVRSASRVGYSDFGVNRKRVESIRSRLQALTAD